MLRFRRRHVSEAAPAPGRQRGQSLVELAFIAPVLLMMGMGVFEFGRAAHAWIAVTHGARDGARWAMDPERTNGEVLGLAEKATGRLEENQPGRVTASFPGGRSPEGRASVRVTYEFTSEVPLVSTLWGGGSLFISRTMISEGDAL